MSGVPLVKIPIDTRIVPEKKIALNNVFYGRERETDGPSGSIQRDRIDESN